MFNPTPEAKLSSLCILLVAFCLMAGSIVSPLPFLMSGNPIGLVIGGILCGSCTIPMCIGIASSRQEN